MNNSTFTCDDRLIRAMLREELSDVESNSLLDHIEQCRHCQSRVNELAASSEEWNQAAKILADSADEASCLHSPKISGLGEEPVVWTESMAQQLLAPPTHPEMLGSLGRYEVERLIGTGGMGVVFKAFDSELNRPVAIKVLAPHLAGSGAARRRFEREARAAAAVVHQHVVPIHNVETERDTPFLVMYYVAGESLQSRVDREGTLELREILRIGMQVASGLSAAHQQGLVHRDIKPSNILLEGGDVERALITDFGLARAADDASLTRSGFHLGTPQYMSPEQARGEAIDQQSDLFSLGSVLYTVCTGRPPFRAETSYGVMRRITDEAPTSIREINPDLPEWLEMIIDKLMSKDKAQRFECAEGVHQLLATCLHHVQRPSAVSLPLQLTKSMSGPRRPRRFGPLRIMLAVSASLLLVLLLGVVYYIQTDNGTVRVEVLDESLSVTIKGERVIVRKGDDQTLTLRAGEHQLVVKQGDIELFTDNFRIRRGDKQVFTAELLKGKVVLSSQGQELQSKLIPDPPQKLTAIKTGRGSSPNSRETPESSSSRLSLPVIELKWAASEHIPGFTHHENRGDYTGNAYYSLKPVLVLTPEFVKSVKHVSGSPLPSGGRISHWVSITLNEKALALLEREIAKVTSDTAKAKKVEYVTLLVDGEEGFSATLSLGWKDGVFNGPNWTTGEKAEQAVKALTAPPSEFKGPKKVYVETARVLRGHRDHGAKSIAVSPDGKLLASASQLKVLVRKTSNGEIVTEIDRSKGSVVFDPRGKVLAAVNLSGVSLWDVATGKKLRTFKTEIHPFQHCYGVAFSPDGRRLALGSERGLKVWDLESGKELHSISAHFYDGNMTDVAFSPDGTRIASANRGGNIASNGKTVKAPNEVKVWDAKTGKRLATLSGGGHGVAFSPDGKRIASGNYFDGTASVWDIATEKEIHRLRGHKHGVAAIAFSPNGQWLATAGRDNLVKIWNPRTGREVATLRAHEREVRSVTFSPDGKRLYSASEDKSIRVWEIGSIDAIHKEPQQEDQSAQPAPDGAELAAIAWVKSVDGRIIRGKSQRGPGPVVYVGLARGAGSDRNADPVTDEGLKQLAAFPQLFGLGLGSSRKVTGEGIKGLATLKSLRDLSYTGSSSDCIKALSHVKSLRRLSLFQSSVKDSDLKHLIGLPLRKLCLSYTSISDAGLKHVTALKSLDSLHLDHTSVSDTGIEQLSTMRSLRTLNLSSTGVSRAGMKDLTRLKNLQALSLEGLKIGDADVELLTTFKGLRRLSLYDNLITDIGLNKLASLQELRRLSLASTKITDTGIQALAACTKLEMVDLAATKVTRAGMKKLRQALPKCLVTKVPTEGGGGIPDFKITRTKDGGFLLEADENVWP